MSDRFTKMETSDVPVLSLPYAERQMIVVVDDALYEAEKKAKEKHPGETDWEKTSKIIAQALKVLAFPTEVLIELSLEVIKSINNLRHQGIKVLTIPRSQAQTLKFSPGHPREKVLYIGHPVNPEVYFTVAEFHRKNFEHKFSEAVRLLMHLGATSIRVEHVSGWAKEFMGNVSVPMKIVNAGGQTEARKSSEENLLFVAHLDGTKTPSLPKDLVWYDYEPTWQQIVEGRLECGLKEFSLTVSYEDDYGINSDLRVKAKNAGLELGGSFTGYQSTVWKIEGEFGEISGQKDEKGNIFKWVLGQ